MKYSTSSLFIFILLAQSWLAPFVVQAQSPTSTNPIIPLEPEVENPNEEVGLIVLSDESPLQVLDMLEKLTDRIILRRQDIAAAKINFNSRGPLSKSEAVLALESLLSLNGIMLTEMGDRFMKAVPATNVNSHVPEMIITSTLDLPPSQQIYAKLFKLQYLQAETTSGTTITPLLSQSSSAVIFQKSNAILITDALINLQRIERLVNELDKPQHIREEIKFVRLDFVQATEMQQRIENLIQGPLKNYLEGNTSVTADERTNQLILITHPGNLEIIMNIIKSVDVDAAPLTDSEVFPLRQAKAEDVVSIIEEIITGQQEGREQDAKVSQENNNTPQTTTPPPIPGVPPAQATAPTPATIATNLSASLANSSLQFSNFVGLSADERTNSIVAYGTHQDLKTLRNLIEKIDIPLPQVLIEAIITQVSLNEDKTSGINELQFNYDGETRLFSDIIIGAVQGISITEGIIDLDNPENFSLATSILPINSDSETKVLSAPRVIVSHNEEGVINVSESRPIITSSTSFTASDNNVRSNVEYRDIGIQLTVTPLIGADGTVQMTVEQTVENIVDNVTIDGNDQPVIGRREATSTVSVNDGQIVILGGLQQNLTTKTNSYFPIIGKWPVIRNFLGADSEEFRKTEVIIFIRPKVLRNPAQAGEFADEYIENKLEATSVQEYLETGTTGNIHMEGSKFEDKLKPKEKRKKRKLEEKKTTAETPAPEAKETDLITIEFEKAAALTLEEAIPEIRQSDAPETETFQTKTKKEE